MAKSWRFDSTKWKFLDKIKLTKGMVRLEYDSKYFVDSIMAGLEENSKEKIRDKSSVAWFIGNLLYQTVLPYVPEETGKLAAKGMKLTSKAKGSHAEISLDVRNTKAVPYALYQYYGKVWGPNYATWGYDKVDTKKKHQPNSFYTMRRMNIVQSGWVSPKGKGAKHPTNQDIGVPRTYTLKDGRQIVVKGYTNPNSQPKWLEYVRHTPAIWTPFTQKVTNAVRAKFGERVKAQDRENLWQIRMRYVEDVTTRQGHISN